MIDPREKNTLSQVERVQGLLREQYLAGAHFGEHNLVDLLFGVLMDHSNYRDIERNGMNPASWGKLMSVCCVLEEAALKQRGKDEVREGEGKRVDGPDGGPVQGQ